MNLLIWAHLTLCDPVDCSPPSSSVQGIFQARILEWVAISHFRGSSLPRDRTLISCVSCIGRWILYHCTTWEAWQFIGGKLPTSRWDAGVFWPVISRPNCVFFWKALEWRENNHWPLTGIVLKDSRHTISNSVSHSQRPWLCEFVAAAFRQAKGNQCHRNAGQYSDQKMSFFSKCHIYNFYWSVMTDSE